MEQTTKEEPSRTSATYSFPEEMLKNEYHFTSQTWARIVLSLDILGARTLNPTLIGKTPISKDQKSRLRPYYMENINTSRNISVPPKTKISRSLEWFALHAPE
jgi:hypothetical protein